MSDPDLRVNYITKEYNVELGRDIITLIFKPQLKEHFIDYGSNYSVIIYLDDKQWSIFDNYYVPNLKNDTGSISANTSTGLRFEVPSMVCWSESWDSDNKTIQYEPIIYPRNTQLRIVLVRHTDHRDDNANGEYTRVFKVQECDDISDYSNYEIVSFKQNIHSVYFLPNRKDRTYSNDSLLINYSAFDPQYQDCFKEENKLSLYKANILFSNEKNGDIFDIPVTIKQKLFVDSYYIEPEPEEGQTKPVNNLIIVRPSLIPDWVYPQLLPITNKYVYDDGTFGTRKVAGCCKLTGFNRIIKKAEYEGDTSVGIATTYSKKVAENRWEYVPFDSTIDLSTVPLN